MGRDLLFRNAQIQSAFLELWNKNSSKQMSGILPTASLRGSENPFPQIAIHCGRIVEKEIDRTSMSNFFASNVHDPARFEADRS